MEDIGGGKWVIGGETSCDIGKLVEGIRLKGFSSKGSMQMILDFDKIWHLVGTKKKLIGLRKKTWWKIYNF